MSEIRHIVDTQSFSREFVESMMKRADEMRGENGYLLHRERSLRGRTLFSFFYEPSTRTRFSFEKAAKSLGMDVVSTENAGEFSSAVKGESLKDTIRVLCELEPDVIVLRHKETGSSELAAAHSRVPIINGGDGAGQHPTQAFLDVYTIQRERGCIDGATVLMGGDLANGRTVRSLAYKLAKFEGIRLIFVSPEPLAMMTDIKDYLTRKGVPYFEESRLEEVLPEADVVYWTRIQKERLPEPLRVRFEELQQLYIIGERELALMKPNAVIMHPLPRNIEIAECVDNDARAAYFRQVGNGFWMRRALLEWVLT